MTTTTKPSVTLAELAALFDGACVAYDAAVIEARRTAEAHKAASRERNAATTREQERMLSSYRSRPPEPGPEPITHEEAIDLEVRAAAANKESHHDLAAAEVCRAALGEQVSRAMFSRGVKYAYLDGRSGGRLLVDLSEHPRPNASAFAVTNRPGEPSEVTHDFRAPSTWFAEILPLPDASQL